jgi:hypothetical protein
MQAIAELIGALVEAFVAAFVALLEAFVALSGIVLEFVFLALTRGLSAASERYNYRKDQRAARAEAEKEAVQASATQNAPSVNLKHVAILASITVLVFVGSVAAWVVRDRIRKQRIAETRSQVNRLADRFAVRFRDDEIVDPEPGKLRDRDAWHQPMELFIDEALLGTIVVVRSSGPDRKSGSIDDIIAIRVIRASAKDVGGELANRGIKALRDRVVRRLPGVADQQLPADMEVGKQ